VTRAPINRIAPIKMRTAAIILPEVAFGIMDPEYRHSFLSLNLFDAGRSALPRDGTSGAGRSGKFGRYP